MRMAFGLVGILVTLGVIIWYMHVYELPAAQQAITVKKQVDQRFGSNTAEGLADAKASITLEDVERGGHFNSLMVKSVVPGGEMATDFGFMAGDQITAIGGFKTRDMMDSEDAQIKLFEAKMRQQPVTVLRNGKEINLLGKI